MPGEPDAASNYEYPDALPTGPGALRGRGASLSPGNRFESVRLSVDGEYLDHQRDNEDATPAKPRTQVLPDHTRTIINRVADSPDIPFDWTINPYRGCEHGCFYCYARPTHEYLGMNCGLDFETKIMAKFDAAVLLRKELAAPKWQGEPIALSGVTDPYQPIERDLRITRRILEVLAEYRQAVTLVTKNRLIVRDLDLLLRLAEHNAVRTAISLTTLDAKLAAKMEPRASSPNDRLRAIRELSAAGIEVTVMTAPVIPGLTDTELPALLEAAVEAGATGAGYVMLRLPYQLRALYQGWFAQHLPEKAVRAEQQLRRMRRGDLYHCEFGSRMRGEGAFAEQIGRLFEVHCKRLGLSRTRSSLNTRALQKPRQSSQYSLF